MAFNVKQQYGESIQTCKTAERVVVQLVEVTNAKDEALPPRIDIRIVVNDRSTKIGFGFDSKEAVADFVAALEVAALDLPDATVSDPAEAVPVVPIVPVAGRAAKARSAATAARAKAKAVKAS